ncbi:unnamed protein product [Didymodactylos carnosus]|uniref:Uncharacterized protein n=1 Tax=Didymodactylos carnosus TaxID=1234261 RepID=A0A8S2CX85_9BILA|nr:unnamed protein product [Didymodactylos carnosus]CAF3611260.1 unnamed protein product [Didymodactylos carnosus]
MFNERTFGQALAAFLIVLSLIALMTLIYFLLEDIIKERIEPHPLSGFKSYEVREFSSVSRQPSIHSEAAVPIPTPTPLTPQPRLPTPPIPTPPRKESISAIVQKPVVDVNKVRQELLLAIDQRTIERLENAIQQVKDNNFTQELKYEYERALEVLSRLMKIEQMNT